jgi:RNase P subunit RPR2
MVISFCTHPQGVKPRRAAKDDAAAIVRLLTESSVALAGTDMELARRQAALARRVMLRFNIRLDPSLKRFTCRGCKSLLVPGINARVRLGHGKPAAIRITCLDCGRVSRKLLGQP